jgi:hypothetical protein
MNNTAMSNQTDLDWLARNVHEWPAGKNFAQVSRDVYFYITKPSGVELFTRQQWLSRRAELQNKPSWANAPEWAEWLCQNNDGEWSFHSQKPVEQNGFPSFRSVGSEALRVSFGEVLSDWRDTLERRPEAKTRARAEVELVNAVAEVFQPFTSIEDNQEQVMTQNEEIKQQDNGWFERGELPPVGVVCEFCWEDDEWTDWHKSVFVGFDSMGNGVVSAFGDHKGLLYFSNKPSDFRPLRRTERDILLSVITEEMNRYDTDGKLADAIIAAGFKLVVA